MSFVFTNPHLGAPFLKSAMMLLDSFQAVLVVPGWVMDLIKEEGLPLEAHQLYSRYFEEGVPAIIVAYRLYKQDGKQFQLMVYVCRQEYAINFLAESNLPGLVTPLALPLGGKKPSYKCST